MLKKVVHHNTIGKITLYQNARSRSFRLIVKPDRSIFVSFPLHVSGRDAIRFAEQHQEWIKAQMEKIETSLPKYSEDSIIKTRFCQITLHKHPGPFTVIPHNEEISIMIPKELKTGSVIVQEYIRKALTGISRWEANKFLPQRVKELAGKYHFLYNHLSIRNNKSNWGSCSANNNISLNLHLMKLPDHLIDFIILHELAHTRIKNHSPAFWNLLDTLTGNQAKELTREIKKYNMKIWYKE